MNHEKIRQWVVYTLFLLASLAFAKEVKFPLNDLTNQSWQAPNAYWVFSGMVSTEEGVLYSYFFQIERKQDLLLAKATLIDSQSKAILLYEEAKAPLADSTPPNWQVGRAFMQFNPINNSWVFGVKTKANKGFNFKADMLSQVQEKELNHDLRPGVKLFINQTGRLNGHLQTGEPNKEQFVTAPNAWFRQVWSNNSEGAHPLTGILCQFVDGSGFYANNLIAKDAVQAAFASWFNKQGKPVATSQFVSLKAEKERTWQITIPTPKHRFSFQDSLSNLSENHQLIAGFIKGKNPGFCSISREEIG